WARVTSRGQSCPRSADLQSASRSRDQGARQYQRLAECNTAARVLAIHRSSAIRQITNLRYSQLAELTFAAYAFLRLCVDYRFRAKKRCIFGPIGHKFPPCFSRCSKPERRVTSPRGVTRISKPFG